MKLDLHTHSTYSDGTLEPQELIVEAQKAGITHLALCDHDSTSGLAEAAAQAAQLGLEVIPAVEINTQETQSVIHILGYFLDPEEPAFQAALNHHRELRQVRAQMIIEKLRKMGIRISLSDFAGRKQKAAIGRPHIADKLKELGVVFSRQEAFDKYLARNRPGYVFYDGPSPQFAIEIILKAKGIPVLAHPGYSVSPDAIAELKKLGLQGIEAHYPSHSLEQRKKFVALAAELDLLVTGGSDYHGPGSGHEGLGETAVPEAVYETLLQRRQKLFHI